MAIPDGFEQAYDGLVGLVGRVAAGRIREEVLREEADAWRREDCRGAASLAEAATGALRYELASRGAREGPDSVSEEMRALGRILAALGPPKTAGEHQIAEVALAEEFRRNNPNARGFRMGELGILFEPTNDREGAVHFSVSHPSRYPTWEELLRARHAPGGPPPHLWAWLPKPGTEPGMNPNTLHLHLFPPEGLVG
ncbi:hypothetical protein GBA65_22100 (plasmid) [Rubrobacter marinus]|uniref:DUF7694 domain-containing protein n=1 Tax=Rubrobacter marinus TaxID=2653852 RepID=A0A6G8Q3U9_9ACTN|nr:hypothetical protein [Rubrobacter marinus]QIN81128.1 hypothetical protein GBA65_22100 [Rubrobacter marinus]